MKYAKHFICTVLYLSVLTLSLLQGVTACFYICMRKQWTSIQLFPIFTFSQLPPLPFLDFCQFPFSKVKSSSSFAGCWASEYVPLSFHCENGIPNPHGSLAPDALLSIKRIENTEWLPYSSPEGVYRGRGSLPNTALYPANTLHWTDQKPLSCCFYYKAVLLIWMV